MALQVRKLMRYAIAGWVPGGRRRCVLCGHRVWRFMPYRKGSRGVAPLMHALELVGSDVDHHECPRCGAHDRERHLLMYMHASGLMPGLEGLRILHFAPEKRLGRLLAAQRPAAYERCDLYPASADVRKVDIQTMPFSDGSFDLLIANHVLEHVDDDLAAIAEITRVLAPGGRAILQTPYSRVLHKTWGDGGITGKGARLQAYGQEDHVRLFGRDIFKRIGSAGLVSRVSHHDELLLGADARVFGVNQLEPFFLFQKPL
ncbi:methyltransferase domain-containing protein [Luteimonas sp. MJ293]|uniref:class I SAM-dependent methyltransferase n=1 Tax=Luteimonas sp. MJ146 TaxID=3129240 RepID=UPI0031B9AEC9